MRLSAPRNRPEAIAVKVNIKIERRRGLVKELGHDFILMEIPV